MERQPAGQVLDIATYGSYAYLGSASLHILDITDPAQPVELGTVPDFTDAHKVKVIGAYAYVFTTMSDHIAIFDLANPAAPPSGCPTGSPFKVVVFAT